MNKFRLISLILILCTGILNAQNKSLFSQMPGMVSYTYRNSFQKKLTCHHIYCNDHIRKRLECLNEQVHYSILSFFNKYGRGSGKRDRYQRHLNRKKDLHKIEQTIYVKVCSEVTFFVILHKVI